MKFTEVKKWDELTDIDRDFLQEWLIDRMISDSEQSEEDKEWALEWYNANGVALDADKVYEIGFDGRQVDGWWEYRGTDAELLAEINEADDTYGSGTFESVDDVKNDTLYIQTQDYMGILFT